MLPLIAGLLYAGFGVVRHALIVMLNVPFALVGGIASLWLRGLHLKLSAAVGIIAVFGGIISSTILTLLVRPTLYGWVEIGHSRRVARPPFQA